MVVILNQRKVEGDEVTDVGRGQIIKAMVRSLDFIMIEIRCHCRFLSIG